MADEHELTWHLSDAGMDLLERAGLAGLYMALRSVSEAGTDLSPLTWREEDLKPNSVKVRWSGPAKPGFVRLMEWAWQVREGVLYLPAVHDAKDAAMIQNRVAMHNGIMRTFLQHTNVQPKGKPMTRVITLDEDREIDVSYQPPIIRPRKSKKNTESQTEKEPKKLLKPWEDIEELFDQLGHLSEGDVKLSSWISPGCPNRYPSETRSANWKEKPWRGPAKQAVLLMLAATVCLFQRLHGDGGNWVYVLPDIRDLEEFNDTRRRMALNLEFVDVASLGDAGLQFLAEYSTRNPRKSLGSGCRVVAMGRTSYYGKKPGQKLGTQSIRKSVLDVPPDPLPVKRYRILHRELPNNYVALRADSQDTPPGAPEPKGGGRKPSKPAGDAPKAGGFIKLPAARGRIADNLVSGRAWYRDLTAPTTWDHEGLERQRKRNKELNDRDGGNRPTSHETILFSALRYQRSKLMKLIAEHDMWDTEAEKVFVEAFWETLDALYAQEAAATERGGSRTVEDRFDDLNDDIRRRLTQAKTRTLLRSVLADLFAKAGRQKTIRTHPAAVWRLIDHPDHWQKGRDLALLALASHRKKEDRESTTTSDKGADR
jgi:CRISPR-associated protein Cas8a1/Csx13